jgi:hypothetical protein
MEAMSVERILLSTWEQEDFVGKTRVPVRRSDVDALAMLAQEGRVRVGECKAWGNPKTVYFVDDYHLAKKDFLWWLDDPEPKWLDNLPLLWNQADGKPEVRWLLPLSQVKEIEFVFACDLHVICDPQRAGEWMLRTVEPFLRKNTLLAEKLDSSEIALKAQVKPTVELATDLIAGVFKEIKNGYNRRFGGDDPSKDLFREVYRYLHPDLYTDIGNDIIPKDKDGNPLAMQPKKYFYPKIRNYAVRRILAALEITEANLRAWLGEASAGNEA